MIEREKIARKIMKKMADVLVARKSELVDLIRDDVNPEDPAEVVDVIMKMLVQSGLITPLYACETTFAITQKGMREISR
jgi:predicted transcriptional regulator